MRLSEAILLGDTLKIADPTTWISSNGSCGCALGGALLAAGFTAETIRAECMNVGEYIRTTYPWGHIAETPSVKKFWPWLTVNQAREISKLYYNVWHERAHIEELVDYVRSIEPDEVADGWNAPMAESSEVEEVRWK